MIYASMVFLRIMKFHLAHSDALAGACAASAARIVRRLRFAVGTGISSSVSVADASAGWSADAARECSARPNDASSTRDSPCGGRYTGSAAASAAGCAM